MTRSFLLAAVACTLAACGGKGEDNSSAGNDNTANATVAPVRPVAIPTPAPTPSPRPITELPTTMRGRWALVAADCEPGRADNKGLMTVAATKLTFYESRATLDTASIVAPDRVAVQLSFSGEGQTWSRREMLTLLDDGRTLLREEQAPVTSERYSRCPD